jgi:predicted HAD superfamily Cof-like phosphohydrolase
MNLNDAQQDVAKFMTEVCQVKVRTRPSRVSEQEQMLCTNLIQEEFGELTMAMWHLRINDKLISADYTPEELFAELADGIADLLYVVLYAANVYGIDMQEIWNEVQRSNMTKMGGEIRADGKLIKPATYEPANILPIITRRLQNA